jgi:NADH:ubiquinone oxidoreductase subunit 3 (subunit A)
MLSLSLALAGGLLARGASAPLGRGSDQKQDARPRETSALQEAALLILTAVIGGAFALPFAAGFSKSGLPGLLVFGLFCVPLVLAAAYLRRRGAFEW